MNIINKNLKFKENQLEKIGQIKGLCLHHSGVTTLQSVEDIHNAHLKNGWAGIGYHYYVRKDGTIFKGRNDIYKGSHCPKFNSNYLGICFEGNFETEQMNAVQLKAGKDLIFYLTKTYNISEIKLHKEGSATLCPGKKFPVSEMKNAIYKKSEIIYRVQVGAFSKKENAEKLKSELIKKGFTTIITTDKSVNVGTIYRVQVGAFSKKENALNTQKSLEKMGYKSILKY